MKSEAGVHRLVRVSPFDPSKKRHTTFAQVLVYPEIEENTDVSKEDILKDVRMDTYRSSGAGGQSVQKTDSAVRLTHVPSGETLIRSNLTSDFFYRVLTIYCKNLFSLCSSLFWCLINLLLYDMI